MGNSWASGMGGRLCGISMSVSRDFLEGEAVAFDVANVIGGSMGVSIEGIGGKVL